MHTFLCKGCSKPLAMGEGPAYCDECQIAVGLRRQAKNLTRVWFAVATFGAALLAGVGYILINW